MFRAVIERPRRAGAWTHLWTGRRGLVRLLARANPVNAAMLLGAVRARRRHRLSTRRMFAACAVVRDEFEDALGREEVDAATARGKAMADHEATDLALAAIQRRLTGV